MAALEQMITKTFFPIREGDYNSEVRRITAELKSEGAGSAAILLNTNDTLTEAAAHSQHRTAFAENASR
jgi:hypothetical protein